MKIKYKYLFGMMAMAVCILFGCEKREAVSFGELTVKEAEDLPVEDIPEREKAEEEADTSGGVMQEETLQSAALLTEEAVLVVHICGAVNMPGVYELPAGSRIYEAVSAAGGFCEEADRDFLNQAQLIDDGSRICVPTKEETALAGKEPQAFISGGADSSAEGGGNSGPVNINTASKEELCALSGIGSGRAESIINYRRENGKFHTIEEIMNVEGIKDGLFQKIKDKITV